MDAIAAIRTRRSFRVFEDRPVERALIEAVIADAAHAPFTPLSRDGAWLFAVVNGRERVAGYGDLALSYARAHRPQRIGYEWTERPDFSVFHGAPCAVIIAGREAVHVALEECTRAGQIFEIAAHARGLGSCWIGSPMLWLDSTEGRKELGLNDGWRPYAAFALGHPSHDRLVAIPRAVRPPVQTLWIGAD